MTNRVDILWAAVFGPRDTVKQNVRQAGERESSPVSESLPSPGQDAIDGGVILKKIQAPPAAPNYRRSLFRR